MLARALFIFLLVGVLCGPAARSRAATPEQIDRSIEAGKKFLYDSQLPDGTWEGIKDFTTFKSQAGGVTCMCVYALLTAGESDKNPRLEKAVKYVLRTDITGTYSMAFQALALGKMTQTPEVQKAVQKVARHLLSGGQRKGAEGLYFYDYKWPGAGWDHSNSQYGALGMWACADAGIEVPDKYWEDVQHGWRRTVDKDGGWQYDSGTSMSMTSAGVATLFVADDALAYRTLSECRGNVNDKFIDDGIKWITDRIKTVSGLYTWYGIERIGVASGYKYFGSVDWFKEGADQVVKSQEANGSWTEAGSFQVGTTYALLFLVRGKAPILMNKLRYDKNPSDPNPADGPWNERNRDAAGAAKFIGDQLESFLNWQVVTLAVDPDEIHDSPILYIAGNEPLNLSPAQEAKLRRFIEDGGLILANADCASTSFSESFRALCKRLVDGQYEFRKLPADSPILTREQFPGAKWKPAPAIEALSNGVRELAILIPSADPARAWQVKQFKTKRESFELIADIYLYSVDRQNITQKGVTYIVKPDPQIKPSTTIKLARLQYAGNSNPEPSGWRRLAAFMHNRNKIDLAISPVKLGAAQLDSFTIAHLTGTSAFKLDDASRDEIKNFVSAGGTLIVDAAGGSTEFADAAEKELTAIFGADAQQLQSPVPGTSALYGDMKPEDFTYRNFVHQAGKSMPRGSLIRTIQIDHRIAVIFSREDISAGLVGQNVDGILGYSPETATRLMASIIQSTLPKPPSTRP